MSVAEADAEELTCCHGATWCNPRLREIPVSSFICPGVRYATLFWLATVASLLVMGYALLYMYLGETVLPGGCAFGVLGVVVAAYFLGWGLAYLPYLNLPPVFGMLLAGIIVRNTGLYNIHDSLGLDVSSKIRLFSVTFVMLRAGLQLTSSALREHPFFVLNLAVVPCSLEMLTVAICAHLILGYPWIWGFLAGSVIACISPVVTINCMAALSERGYGEDKDIATLLFTAASIDDIHIVSVYAICFSLIFTNDDRRWQWWSYVPSGLRDLFFGLLLGSLLGLFFGFFPHRSHKYAQLYRISCLVFGSLVCTTLTTRIAIAGGGFLATIAMSLVATRTWRILSKPFNVVPLRKAVHIMWHIMQPVLVGVIGAEMEVRNWSISRVILHLICILLGLSIRTAFAFLATFHTPFNFKERTFIALSWLAKGTLQAALAPMVLDQAEMNEDSMQYELALDMENLSILTIMLFAPLGAIIMMVTGPLLLTKGSEEQVRERRENSVIKIESLQPVRHRTSDAYRFRN